MRAKIGIFTWALVMMAAVTFASAAEPKLSSLKFKDTEITTVFKAIEKKAEQEGKTINIVTTPEVYGLVTVDLENVDWKTALKVILKMYDLGYTQDGSILTVSSLEKIAEEQKKEDEALFASGGMKIEAFKLRYVEAADVAKMIQPFLSKDGQVSIMDVVNKQGWGFSASTSGIINVSSDGSSGGGQYPQPGMTTTTTKMTRTKILAVSDTPAVVRQIGVLLSEVDVAPKQILIRTVILEVNRDKVFDLGLDFGTPTDTPGQDSILSKRFALGSASRFNSITPTAFIPPEGSTAGIDPYAAGLNVAFSKVEGTKFEVILHALQEDANTNTLSTPTILTLDNREASILVGTQYPIVETSTSTESANNVIGGNLQQYQNVGIQLRVVPQICGEDENLVNLIVHPTVSNINGFATVNSAAGAPITQYPIIDTREAETQMMIEDGETVVLGGLLSDAKTDEVMGVPYLSDIPFIGKLFDRNTKNGIKTDLLIFLTVKIVRPSDVLPADVLDRTAIDQKAKGI